VAWPQADQTVPVHDYRSGEDTTFPAGTILRRLTAPGNFTGLPAISVPCGFTAAGLPFGLQLMARPFEEARLLAAAHAYEQATPWHTRRPTLATA
jgi:aspartyl-tRNA(Asn)/glutamyl-tRNA(Gln) amidotransferase subunit A